MSAIRTIRAFSLVAVVACSACVDAPTATDDLSGAVEAPLPDAPGLAKKVRQLAAAHGVVALPPAPAVRAPLVALGRMLAFDKVLSGNHDIACMTCHEPALATGDTRALAIGQGATGIGQGRVHPQGVFIPRNAPSLYNLDVLDHLFWDGRVFRDASGLHTPAGALLAPDLAAVLELGPASALPLFPVTSRSEMRGVAGTNELAAIDDADLPAIWAALAARIKAIPAYQPLFAAAYPGTPFEDITFAHAANAIGGFLVATFAMRHSAWDRFLAGDDNALTQAQLLGAQIFFDKAACAQCHRGPDFTDEEFDDTAIPQLGPGEGDGAGGVEDFGRARVTGDAAERFAFRTAPLRNVAITGPWGHDGAFGDLRAFAAHYLDPAASLRGFDPSKLEPGLRGTVVADQDAILAGLADELAPGSRKANAQELDELVAFLGALTDPAALDQGAIVPASVPSGLPVD